MNLPRALTRLTAMLTGIAFAVAAHPALASPLLAEEGGGDRAKVIIWTVVAVAVTIVLLAIGYVYRRAAGIEKPPPVPILEPGQRITGD
jgi:small-conductance mechanosensitive channel